MPKLSKILGGSTMTIQDLTQDYDSKLSYIMRSVTDGKGIKVGPPFPRIPGCTRDDTGGKRSQRSP